MGRMRGRSEDEEVADQVSPLVVIQQDREVHTENKERSNSTRMLVKKKPKREPM